MGKPVGFSDDLDLIDADGTIVCNHGTPEDRACGRCDGSCGWNDGDDCRCEVAAVTQLYEKRFLNA